MDYYTIVKRLIGPIEPYGSTEIDEERFNNLKEQCALIDSLLYDIYCVSKSKSRYEHSMREMGEYADKFLKNTEDTLKSNLEQP